MRANNKSGTTRNGKYMATRVTLFSDGKAADIISKRMGTCDIPKQ